MTRYKAALLAPLNDDEDWQDAEAHEYLYHLIGFCGCGRSSVFFPYLRKALRYLEWRRGGGDYPHPYEEILAKELDVFGSEEAAMFMYYWLDSMGMTEHGGSVPGWLDTKGHLMLEALDEMLGEQDE